MPVRHQGWYDAGLQAPRVPTDSTVAPPGTHARHLPHDKNHPIAERTTTSTSLIIRVEGSDLPGRTCGPGPDYRDGHHNIHVAVQGRKGQQDLLGLVPGDRPTMAWDLESTILAPPPDFDVRGRRSRAVRVSGSST